MDVFRIIFPVLAIALAGYLVAYWNLLTSQDIQGLSRFVFRIAFPVLLFYSFARMEFPDQINWKFLVSYYLVALITFAIGYLVKRNLFSGQQKDQVIYALGTSFSNLVLVGLPILLPAFGDEIILPLFMIVSVQSAVLFSLSTILIEGGQAENGKKGLRYAGQILIQMIKNPIILGILTGIAFNLLKVPLPDPLNTALDIFSKVGLPCGLFMLGASLNEFKIQGQLHEAGIMVAIKMILQPFLVWVLTFLVLNLDPLWAMVAVLAAGMPIGINTYLFASHNQADTRTISTSILFSSILAILTQSIMITYFLKL